MIELFKYKAIEKFKINNEKLFKKKKFEDFF